MRRKFELFVIFSYEAKALLHLKKSGAPKKIFSLAFSERDQDVVKFMLEVGKGLTRNQKICRTSSVDSRQSNDQFSEVEDKATLSTKSHPQGRATLRLY